MDHAVGVATGLAARGVDSHLVAPGAVRRAAGRSGDGVVWHDHEARSKWDLSGVGGLARLLIGLRPDVLHLQDRRAGWVGRGIARLLPATGIVYTLHGVADGLSDRVAGNRLAGPRRRRDSLYYLHGERWVTAWGRARVVSPSHAVAAFAIDHVGLPADRVDVVPNGVDTDRFAPPAPRSSEESPRPRLVWLGGLVPVKRPDLLVEAVSCLTREVEVLVAGSGESEGAVRRLVERLERDRARAGPATVRLLGHVADPAPLLRGADGYLLTSDAESCPMALLQAMATGLPAVATAVGGVPEVLGPVSPGLLCPPGAPGLLARAIDGLLADPARARDLGAASRRRVLDHYTTDHCLDGLQATYDTARAQGGR